MNIKQTLQQNFHWLLVAVLLAVLPLFLQNVGHAWVRIADIALLYVLLAVGLNIVVGYAGLLDLGYVAFYAIGAYTYALLSSPHLIDNFASIAVWAGVGATSLQVPAGICIVLAAILAAILGVLLGAPTLRLRGDYLAIVTLGFGEIIRIFMQNLDRPLNITNGPQGLSQIEPIRVGNFSFGGVHEIAGFELASVTLYYYLFLVCVLLALLMSYRLENSRIGRAWMAIREDEIAARAMGLNTRNLKLLAFAMGATFGGVSGALFASFQGFISPESFSLMESIMIVAMVVLGGLGHLPGVVLGAVLLASLPEILRYVASPLQALTGGHLDPAILRQLLIALAMIGVMLLRPKGLWPAPLHGRVWWKKSS